jgi:hypothetical protein
MDGVGCLALFLIRVRLRVHARAPSLCDVPALFRRAEAGAAAPAVFLNAVARDQVPRYQASGIKHQGSSIRDQDHVF